MNDKNIIWCNDKEEMENKLKTFTKEIHFFWDDSDENCHYDFNGLNYYDYLSDETYEIKWLPNETKKSIDIGISKIFTTCFSFLSFDLISCGYRIYIHRNNKILEMKPFMKYKGEKEIRYAHNILKMFIAGHFDEDFK